MSGSLMASLAALRGVCRRGAAVVALAATLVLALFSPAPAHAEPDLKAARALVQEVAAQGIQDILTANVTHAEKVERFRTLFDTYFDLPSIGRFVVGQTWRAATPEEQTQFLELFREINLYTWARRFKDYNGQALVVHEAVADGDKGAFVETQVNLEGDQPPLQVVWRLRSRPDSAQGFKVVDLDVAGVSMAITYRSEYGSVIQREGGRLGGLNDVLAKQLAQLKAQQPG